MKKILLIQQHHGRREPLGAVFPLGLAYLATTLIDHHEVQVLDMNLYDAPFAVLEDRLNGFVPDVVGISIRNIDNMDKRNFFCYLDTVQPTIECIRERSPHARIVAGGSGFSIFAREIMECFSGIDLGVYLEGEESFSELIENLDQPDQVKGVFYRVGTAVKFSGNRTLPKFEDLPIPRRDLFEMHRYTNHMGNIGIQTKRGCALGCIYCSYPFLNGNQMRLRRPEHVVDEIEYLCKNFDIHEFMFVDGVFNSPLPHAVAICEEIIKRNLNVHWAAWCDIKHFTPEFLKLASIAGCVHLPFSPDGATDDSLAVLGKGIKRSDIERTLSLLRDHKEIRASFGLFVIPPRQTYRGLASTLWLYLKINFLLLGRGYASLSWIRIEPHTRIYDIAL